jgi:hypothetical protein
MFFISDEEAQRSFEIGCKVDEQLCWQNDITHYRKMEVKRSRVFSFQTMTDLGAPTSPRKLQKIRVKKRKVTPVTRERARSVEDQTSAAFVQPTAVTADATIGASTSTPSTLQKAPQRDTTANDSSVAATAAAATATSTSTTVVSDAGAQTTKRRPQADRTSRHKTLPQAFTWNSAAVNEDLFEDEDSKQLWHEFRAQSATSAPADERQLIERLLLPNKDGASDSKAQHKNGLADGVVYATYGTGATTSATSDAMTSSSSTTKRTESTPSTTATTTKLASFVCPTKNADSDQSQPPAKPNNTDANNADDADSDSDSVTESKTTITTSDDECSSTDSSDSVSRSDDQDDSNTNAPISTTTTTTTTTTTAATTTSSAASNVANGNAKLNVWSGRDVSLSPVMKGETSKRVAFAEPSVVRKATAATTTMSPVKTTSTTTEAMRMVSASSSRRLKSKSVILERRTASADGDENDDDNDNDNNDNENNNTTENNDAVHALKLNSKGERKRAKRGSRASPSLVSSKSMYNASNRAVSVAPSSPVAATNAIAGTLSPAAAVAASQARAT